MIRRIALSLLLSALLCPPAPAETVTAEMRLDDPRLQKKVTLELKRGNIGDLMKLLARETGVALRADEKDGAADPMIVAVVKGAPLADTLDALWSLLSYKGARWHWSREGEPGKWQYTLRRPLAARNLSAQLRAHVQESFEAEAERVRHYLRMSPKELERHAGTDRQARAIRDSPRHKVGLQVFFECIPEETRRKILRGQERHFRVELSAMPPEARSVILDMWKQSTGYRILSDGTREPTPAPTHVRLDAGRWPGADAAPALGMQVENMGGGNHLGGRWLQEDFARYLFERWILPGDEQSHGKEKEPFDTVRREPRAFRDGGVNETLRHRLLDITDAPGVSLIARLPQLSGGSSWDPASEGPAPLGAYLDRFGGHPGYLQRKWRGDILLVTYPAWPLDEEQQVPRWIVERLRAAKSAGGVLPLSELIHAAGALSREQLRILGRDFAVMNNVASHYGILSFAYRANLASQLQAESGLPLTPEVARAVMADEHGGLIRFLQDGSAKAVRMTAELGSTGGRVTFGVILRDGRWRRYRGLWFIPVKPLQKTNPPPSGNRGNGSHERMATVDPGRRAHLRRAHLYSSFGFSPGPDSVRED